MIRIAIVIAALALAGCGGGAPLNQLGAPAREGDVQFAGVVRYINIEGGFYGIVDDSGADYDPRNLPAGFQQDARRVHGVARVRNDMMSFHMWGTIVDILSIE